MKIAVLYNMSCTNTLLSQIFMSTAFQHQPIRKQYALYTMFSLDDF